MHRRAGEGTVLVRAVLAPRTTGCPVVLLLVWRGGVCKACSSSNFVEVVVLGRTDAGLVVTHARCGIVG